MSEKEINIPFYKYQGTGNDFVVIDHRKPLLEEWSEALISRMCDRKFGIGADGLILLESQEGFDFKMVYYNADGRESTMCGNGGRCMVRFAKDLKIFESSCTFLATDGKHEAWIDPSGDIRLKMMDVADIQRKSAGFELNTGSPHFVVFREDLESLDVVKEGRSIRNEEAYKKEGINVNFAVIRQKENLIKVLTYERGVEDETLSCGTGVVASVLAAVEKEGLSNPVAVETKGGALKVAFEKTEAGYRNIVLSGPAQFVFAGIYPIM